MATIPGIGVTSFIFPVVLLGTSGLFAWFAFVAFRKGAVPTKSKMIHAKEQPVAFGVLATLYAAVAVLALIGAVVLLGTLVGALSI